MKEKLFKRIQFYFWFPRFRRIISKYINHHIIFYEGRLKSNIYSFIS